MRANIQVVIYPGDEDGYLAECLNLAVVTQGQTLDETVEDKNFTAKPPSTPSFS